jgi:O-antigen/teichoic acid export membrane protein
MNCLATIPFALLQGIGHADVTGKFVLIDLPISFVGVWMLTARFGIRGAAIAWAIRATLETLILLALSQRYLARKALALKSLGVSMMVAVSALYIATLASGVVLKFAFLVCALPAFVFVCWFLVLKPEERQFLARGRLRMAVAPSGIATSANGKKDAV